MQVKCTEPTVTTSNCYLITNETSPQIRLFWIVFNILRSTLWLALDWTSLTNTKTMNSTSVKNFHKCPVLRSQVTTKGLCRKNLWHHGNTRIFSCFPPPVIEQPCQSVKIYSILSLIGTIKTFRTFFSEFLNLKFRPVC